MDEVFIADALVIHTGPVFAAFVGAISLAAILAGEAEFTLTFSLKAFAIGAAVIRAEFDVTRVASPAGSA